MLNGFALSTYRGERRASNAQSPKAFTSRASSPLAGSREDGRPRDTGKPTQPQLPEEVSRYLIQYYRAHGTMWCLEHLASRYGLHMSGNALRQYCRDHLHFEPPGICRKDGERRLIESLAPKNPGQHRERLACEVQLAWSPMVSRRHLRQAWPRALGASPSAGTPPRFLGWWAQAPAVAPRRCTPRRSRNDFIRVHWIIKGPARCTREINRHFQKDYTVHKLADHAKRVLRRDREQLRRC